jgi:FkbM family methyltransferase
MIVGDYAKLFNSQLPRPKRRALVLAYTKLLLRYMLNRRSRSQQRVHFLSYTVTAFNYYHFFKIFREIFVDGDYYTPLENKDHDIIDCGANIGLAVVYYKWLMPDAHIECFEPDPTTYTLLKKNIEDNGLKNVSTHNKAVSDKDGSIEFFSSAERPGSPKASTVSARVGTEHYQKISVPAIDFSQYISKRKVKLLKMDIEGSEYQVLRHMKDMGTLINVEELHLEYHHNISGQGYTLSDFLAIFDEEDVSYIIEADMPVYKPPKAKQQDLLIKYRRQST